VESIAHITLKSVMAALMAGRALPRDVSIAWRPGRILYRTAAGEVIVITARQLAPHDPDALELERTLAAIDAGDVE
jgi:hypothetical protein